MTKRCATTMSMIALAVTGALMPNAAFAADDAGQSSEFSVASTDEGTFLAARGTSWEIGHTDRGRSWGSYDTLRGTSWE